MNVPAVDKVRTQGKALLAAALTCSPELTPELAAAQIEEAMYDYYVDEVPHATAASSAAASKATGAQVSSH